MNITNMIDNWPVSKTLKLLYCFYQDFILGLSKVQKEILQIDTDSRNENRKNSILLPKCRPNIL